MKFLITKLKCVAAIVVASAVFGFSTERSEAASSATMVFTVDSGVVTHINITAPFGFYPNSGNTYGSVALVLQDLYPGDTDMVIAEPTETPVGMFSVAGSGVSYEGPLGYMWDMVGAETDGDLALVFGFSGSGLNLTSEDFVEIFGGFGVDPSSHLVAPTAGMYSAVLYEANEALEAPISNTAMVEIIVNSVPEPGSCLLGLVGLASLIVRRKR
jgi:hypothetical protein